MEHIVLDIDEDTNSLNDARGAKQNKGKPKKPVNKKSRRITFAEGVQDNDDQKQKEKGKTASSPNSCQNADVKSSSIPNIEASTKQPDWYEELNDGQIDMFKEVFEMLDRDGGGSLSPEELYQAMKDMDIEIHLDEIKQVLGELDKDGNGEIDFDEFLYAMTETDNYMSQLEDGSQADASKPYNKRQTLFFTAITRFAIKNSLGEIERYYYNKVRQAPHVISCYTAGARLIGLNDRQLEQEIRRMRKAARNQKSPYAQPLPFVTPRRKQPKSAVQKKRRTSRRQDHAPSRPTAKVTERSRSPTRRTAPNKKPERTKKDLPSETSSSPTPDVPESPVSNIEPIDISMTDAVMSDIDFPVISNIPKIHVDDNMLDDMYDDAHRRHNMLETTDEDYDNELDTIHSVCNFQQRARGDVSRRSAITCGDIEVIRLLNQLAESGNVVARIPDIHLVPQIRNKLANGDTEICSSVRRKRRTMSMTSLQLEHTRNGRRSGHHEDSMKRPPGWIIPRIERGKVPLPVVKVGKKKTFTVENLIDIREQVSHVLNKYYCELKKKYVKTAWDHWDQLHTDQIRSPTMKTVFRRAYEAYSPHKVEDVFTISPWVPSCIYHTAQPRNASKNALQQPPPKPQLHVEYGQFATRTRPSCKRGSTALAQRVRTASRCSATPSPTPRPHSTI